jgi:hypothetical protein
MTQESNIPDTDTLIDLFTDAIRNKFKAIELENEALKIRLNEVRLKLELAKTKLEEAGIDTINLDINSNF